MRRRRRADARRARAVHVRRPRGRDAGAVRGDARSRGGAADGFLERALALRRDFGDGRRDDGRRRRRTRVDARRADARRRRRRRRDDARTTRGRNARGDADDDDDDARDARRRRRAGERVGRSPVAVARDRRRRAPAGASRRRRTTRATAAGGARTTAARADDGDRRRRRRRGAGEARTDGREGWRDILRATRERVRRGRAAMGEPLGEEDETRDVERGGERRGCGIRGRTG